LQYDLNCLQEQVDVSIKQHQNDNCNKCLDYIMSTAYDDISEASSDESDYTCIASESFVNTEYFSDYGCSYSDTDNALITLDTGYKKARRKSI